jgi:signal transduction histidine kinase
MMSPEEQVARRITSASVIGGLAALANFALDFSLDRLGIVLATNALNDLLIGIATGTMAYIWISRQAAAHARELSSEKIKQRAVDEERKRIALELHDTVSQDLTSIVLQLESAGQNVNQHSEIVEGILQTARRGLAEMRYALWDLYPEELGRLDLGGAIERLSKDVATGTPLNVQCSVNGLIRRLPPNVEKNLLRISQEALFNVVKHAKAHEVSIELLLDEQRAELSVKDDGQGFQADSIPAGFGLQTMHDRATLLGGDFHICSECGHGTEIRASIPIPRAT